MIVMNIEQHDLAEPRPPDDRRRAVRLNPLIWVAIALIALVVGFFVLDRGVGTPELQRAPTPTSVPATRSPGSNQRQYVGVTTICAPVTDGRRTLAVSFEVSNVSQSRVDVGSVIGVLPAGGLRQHGAAVRGGSCAQTGTDRPGGAIPVGESRFYTLSFDLPKTCPARYSVQVRVNFWADGFDETSLSILYTDLSVPVFDTCGPGKRSKSG